MDPAVLDFIKDLGIIATALIGAYGFYKKVFCVWFKEYKERQNSNKEFKDKINSIINEILPPNGESISTKLTNMSDKNDKMYQRQVRIENKLEYSTQVHKSMMDVMNLAYFESDTFGVYKTVSRGLANLIGCSETDILGNGWIQIVDIEDRDRIVKSWEFTIKNDAKFDEEFCYTKSDRTKLNVRAMALPIKDSKGEVIGFFGTITKI